MSAVFLSASVPVPGRGQYDETADPFLIQCAVRELATVVLGRRLLVWGGHPAITPMLWAICEDLGVEYASAVVLYQSRFFEGQYPEENLRFDNVVYVDVVDNDRAASLLAMREAMLSREDLSAAVFIGGMEGILEEAALFSQHHPGAPVIAISAPGGAARDLAVQLGGGKAADGSTLDFAGLLQRELGIRADEPRPLGGSRAASVAG